MSDLVCVNPRAGEDVYGSLVSLAAKEPPMWCRVFAAHARSNGFSAAIVDADALNLEGDALRAEVARHEPKLVAVVAFGHQPSASTEQMVGARRALVQLREFRTVLLGGHVSALPAKSYLQEDATYACKGEGPATILALLKDLPEWLVPGLVWWNGETKAVVINDPAPLMGMDAMHGAAWDLLPMGLYKAHNWQCLDGWPRQPYASVMTSLGCPYKCSFCCINAPFDTNRYRTREPVDVANEIKMLYDDYGVRTFKIIDEMFVLNPRHYLAVADSIRAHGIGDDINIWAYARVDTVRPHNLALLRAAGFRWLALGIESGSAHVRDGVQKKLRQDDIVEVVRQIQAHGISVMGNYIFGLPDDDESTMQETLDLAIKCQTEFANFYSAMAYPGSRLYLEQKDPSDDWRTYAQVGPYTKPAGSLALTPAQVLAFRDAAFVTYFTDHAYRRRVLERFGQAGDAAIEKMLERKIERAA